MVKTNAILHPFRGLAAFAFPTSLALLRAGSLCAALAFGASSASAHEGPSHRAGPAVRAGYTTPAGLSIPEEAPRSKTA